MSAISNRLMSLSRSATLAMNQKSREMISQGIDIINLSIGEPDFDTPDYIKEAAIQAIHDNFSHYPPVPGFLDLREAVSLKLKRDNDLDYRPSEIIVSNGGKQAIANAMLCIVNPGDEVIIPAPYWVSYPEIVKLAEGESIILNSDISQQYKITPEQLEAAITPRSKAFIFSSPSNPTGQIYSRDELAGLAAVFSRHPQLMVISDEIYEHINYSGKHESIAQFEEIRNQVVVINGVSKGYAMTGWRIGFLAGPEWLVTACQKLQGQYTSGACAIAQKAALSALTGDQSFIPSMIKVFRERRDLVVARLKSMPGVLIDQPQGAFYVLPDISSFFGKSKGEIEIRDCEDIAMYLLNEAHVATVSGAAFGAPGTIRFSYATSTEILEKGLDRIQKALSNLK
ncbi:MAG: pyridoxal phosphate-dependent aminotransferase [Bacteroidales bacterium]|nr:pyridoxal phosphate-dependent aminotransferase [Bacteroidales bacterium]